MQMRNELKCEKILLEMLIALTVKLMENAKRNSEIEKRWQVHLWEMWAILRAKEMLVNQVGNLSDKESSDD